MRMGNFSQFDPTRQFVPRASAVNGNGDEAAAQLPTPIETVEGDEATAPATPSAPVQEEQTTEAPADLPSKPVVNPAAGNASGIARSASQPGAPRFQANGFHSRAQSPAPSNVSFHGNGHPRRAGRPFANGNGTNGAAAATGVRSVSAGENKQRIPGADEFPALGGASGNTSPQEKSTAAFSKTAAQVLSAPAPPKPEPVPAPAAKESPVSEDVRQLPTVLSLRGVTADK
jgi:hypothetical protein